MLKPQGTALGSAFPQEGQTDSSPWGHRSGKQLGKAMGWGYRARHCLVLVPREENQGLNRQNQLTEASGRGAAEELRAGALQQAVPAPGLGWQASKQAGSARGRPLGARLLPPCKENPLKAFSSHLHQQQDEQLVHGSSDGKSCHGALNNQQRVC